MPSIACARQVLLSSALGALMPSAISCTIDFHMGEIGSTGTIHRTTLTESIRLALLDFPRCNTAKQYYSPSPSSLHLGGYHMTCAIFRMIDFHRC
mmetsp:Transcript_6157/g.8868  ORF Transcript_6157/g.8868 Transcript_6157/m.8868 type:complete len:95 (+) Transcript_6157:204-488(+)